MKNIFKYIAVLALSAAALSSCIKETFPENGTATTEQVGASSSALEAAICGIPAQMVQGYLVYGDQTHETDMAYPGMMLAYNEMLGDIVPGTSENAGYDWYRSWNILRNMGGNTYFSYLPWRTFYMFIKSANDVISSVDEENASPALLGYAGMAYTVRAFVYYQMLNLYEPAENIYTTIPDAIKGLTVPIVTEKTDESAGKNNPRATHAELVELLNSDLDKAVKYLDGFTPSSGLYPSLAVAYGMKAKVAMTDGKYADAATAARKAIDTFSGSPMTKEQWLDPVNGFNVATSAWMWYGHYSAETMGNLCNWIGWISPEADWSYSCMYLPCISASLYNSIPKSDFRKYAFLDPTKKAFYDYTSVRGDAYINDVLPPYSALKFRCVGGDWENYATGAAADVPFMRIEEMYYIEAEALGLQNLEQGKTALESFVRTYRDPSFTSKALSPEDFELEILNQKKIEFWGEGIALFDAKRMRAGAIQAYEGTNAPTNDYLMNCEGIKPNWNLVIPDSEMNNNNALKGLNNPDPTQSVTLVK